MKTGKDKRERPACRALASAKSEKDIRVAVDSIVDEWSAARDRVAGALPPLRRLPAADDFRESVLARVASGESLNRVAAEATERLDAFERVAREAEEPRSWAARFRVEGPRLDAVERQRRLTEVRLATARSSSNLAEAIRRVLAARRENGVPLYATYATTVHDRYLAAAAEAELGLIPKASDGATPQAEGRAPWGTFKVRGDVAPELAEPYLRNFPPFPARSELLEARASWPVPHAVAAVDREAPRDFDWILNPNSDDDEPQDT